MRRRITSSLLVYSILLYQAADEAHSRTGALTSRSRRLEPCFEMVHQPGADSNFPYHQRTHMAFQSRDCHPEGFTIHASETERYIDPTPTDSDASPHAIQQSIIGRVARLKTLWQKEVSLLVEPRACRDHLANERTFLAWLRTSLALSMMGIFTAQYFTIQSPQLPHTSLSFFVLGVPLASICQAAALLNIIVGACRFWRHQSAMIKGRACAGGWEILVVGLVITLVSASQFHETNLH